MPGVSRAAYEYVYARGLPAIEEITSSISSNAPSNTLFTEGLFNLGISNRTRINRVLRAFTFSNKAKFYQ